MSVFITKAVYMRIEKIHLSFCSSLFIRIMKSIQLAITENLGWKSNNLIFLLVNCNNTILTTAWSNRIECVGKSVKKTLQMTKRTGGQSLKYWLKDAMRHNQN
jgi:hypothetical protein